MTEKVDTCSREFRQVRDKWLGVKDRFIDYCPKYSDYKFLKGNPERFIELMRDIPVEAILIYDNEFAEYGFFRKAPNKVSGVISKMTYREVSLFAEDIVDADPEFLLSNINIAKQIKKAVKQDRSAYDLVVDSFDRIPGLNKKIKAKKRPNVHNRKKVVVPSAKKAIPA